MLNSGQRWTIFVIFCLSVILCLGLEALLIWSMITEGFSGGKPVAAVLNTLLLGGLGLMFNKMVENTFVTPEILPMARLHQLATKRSRILDSARSSGLDIFETKRELVTNTLQFMEATLTGWASGSHLEFCVFIDDRDPILFGYFDSNHDTVARSMALREKNPQFYIEKNYEVTKVLANPTSQPRVIGDTHDAGAGYSFTTEEQRSQLRSSVLLSLDLQRPIALVVSSNSKDAFDVSDPKLMPFIRYAGELIRSDLLDDGFVDELRTIKPDLFPAAAPSAVGRLGPAVPV